MRIAENVLNVLGKADCTGNALRLVGQLDRPLYLKTNEVLEAAGGKWNKKVKAHIFDGSAADAMEAIILTGEVVRPQDFGFFQTPPELVDRMMTLAAFDEFDGAMDQLEALEPSAGQGAIADAIKILGANVLCVELLPKNCEILRGKGHSLIPTQDFLDWPVPTPAVRFDRILMNPPFAKRADIKHILHAAQFLKPGGRLVSISSASVIFRDDSLARGFRDFVDARGGTIEALPDGSFKSSGTMVNTAIIVFDAASL